MKNGVPFGFPSSLFSSPKIGSLAWSQDSQVPWPTPSIFHLCLTCLASESTVRIKELWSKREKQKTKRPTWSYLIPNETWSNEKAFEKLSAMECFDDESAQVIVGVITPEWVQRLALKFDFKPRSLFNFILHTIVFQWGLDFMLPSFWSYVFLGTDMGVERCVRLDGLTEAQITKKLEELVKAGAALKAWLLCYHPAYFILYWNKRGVKQCMVICWLSLDDSFFTSGVVFPCMLSGKIWYSVLI